MHALLTGGEGYVGTNFTAYLLEHGHRVTTLDSGFSSLENSPDLPVDNLRRFRASVTNIDTLVRAMAGVDIIYHMAERSDLSDNYRHVIRLTDVNVGGLANVLAMARKAGISKIVYVSSAAVYGNVVGAQETDTPAPIDLFGATKVAAESICRGFYQEGMEIVILRLFNVWGGVGSRSVVDKFSNGSNIIYGDGCQTRDFIHISDVCRAMMSAYNWDSNIYNIGTGIETSILGLYKRLNDGKEPVFEDLKQAEVFRSCADIGFTKNTVGFEPTVFFE